MLSDAIQQMRETIRNGRPTDLTGFLLTLRAFELEARNMEERLHCITGLPHVALDGRLVAAPQPVIEIMGVQHG